MRRGAGAQTGRTGQPAPRGDTRIRQRHPTPRTPSPPPAQAAPARAPHKQCGLRPRSRATALRRSQGRRSAAAAAAATLPAGAARTARLYLLSAPSPPSAHSLTGAMLPRSRVADTNVDATATSGGRCSRSAALP